MPAVVVVGAQLGDEAKGGIVDYLCGSGKFTAVARYQGGPNAGKHVVSTNHRGERQEFKWHQLPSGVLYPGILCVIGPGSVVNFKSLRSEILSMEKNLDRPVRLLVSKRAHVILPCHQHKDRPAASPTTTLVGGTNKGIGPTYESKAERQGLRVGDFLYTEEVVKALQEPWPHNYVHSPKEIADLLVDFEAIRPFVGDAVHELNSRISTGENVLLEGAQGCLLDYDLGQYPYVTSSNCTVGGAISGTGIGPKHLSEILGVTKAYCTRVDATEGKSPFPSELFGEEAENLRTLGNEFGVTTGRPRRVGWIDLVALRYVAQTNTLSSFAVTKLDVLSGMETVKLCYEYANNPGGTYPSDPRDLKKVQARYLTLPGWNSVLEEDGKTLHANVREFLRVIYQHTGCRVKYISYGPHKDCVREIEHE